MRIIERAIEKWARLFKSSDPKWPDDTLGFEWVRVDSSRRLWVRGVVTSSVREGNCEGRIVAIYVDGFQIVRAKSFDGEEECAVLAAFLERAFQKRINAQVRRNAIESERRAAECRAWLGAS